ncbi:MAG TPA: alkaline phosphatase family protein [Kofleriaceae bacterium]|nr:alkaline phosphatase family protein [Kofleriaceae bacterium]
MVALALVACGSNPSNTTDGNSNGDGANGSGAHDAARDGVVASGRTVFVIVMENESSSAIYNSGAAPYINNTIKGESAYATMFMDELNALIPSEPHYVWMEAGTNQFTDITFLSDADASQGNSTASTQHLVTQLETAGLGWMSYQEGLPAMCPITSSGFYAAKHDPFVFFTDVSGSPPSTMNAHCAAHHKAYSSFAADLAGTMPAYVFITPNLCNDMHGATGCPAGSDITRGDTWLSNELPRIVTYATAHDSIIYVIWDEGSSNQTIPFFALGPHVKTGMATTVYSHSALLKSIEEQLGVPVLATVTTAPDFAAMYDTGYFP